MHSGGPGELGEGTGLMVRGLELGQDSTGRVAPTVAGQPELLKQRSDRQQVAFLATSATDRDASSPQRTGDRGAGTPAERRDVP